MKRKQIVGLPMSISETGIAVASAENLISCYEGEGKKILKAQGLPEDILELWENKEKYLPDLANGKGVSAIYSAFWMLLSFTRVRLSLEKNDAESAVVDMISALHWAANLQIEPVMPLIQLSEQVVAGGRSGGQKSAKIRGEKATTIKQENQKRALKIWKKHPAWTNSDVARKIQKDHGGNVDTIRKSIQKPLS
jgi:hypothetical protein